MHIDNITEFTEEAGAARRALRAFKSAGEYVEWATKYCIYPDAIHRGWQALDEAEREVHRSLGAYLRTRRNPIR